MGSGCGDPESRSRQMERLFHQMGGGDFGAGDAWSPPTDVFETGGGVVVKMELPGVRKEDLSITLVDDHLFVRGRRTDPEAGQKVCYHLMEIAYGSFVKVVTIQMRYDREGVRAQLSEGFLSLFIPKAREPVSERVMVEIHL